MNFPGAQVFNADCNALLRSAMAREGGGGAAAESALPERGMIDAIVGGPPCQGFSGMNRFSAGEYSMFKNSLVVTYLSYCDYYRCGPCCQPKLCISVP